MTSSEKGLKGTFLQNDKDTLLLLAVLRNKIPHMGLGVPLNSRIFFFSSGGSKPKIKVRFLVRILPGSQTATLPPNSHIGGQSFSVQIREWEEHGHCVCGVAPRTANPPPNSLGCGVAGYTGWGTVGPEEACRSVFPLIIGQGASSSGWAGRASGVQHYWS